MTSRWQRYEPLALLALPILWLTIASSSFYVTDPDSFIHIGCARRLLLEGGCVRSFPQLPYTTLADPFANMFLGQHALLAPFAAILPARWALAAGVTLLSSLLAASLWLVLRRNGVARPTWWVVLGMVAASEPLIYSVYIKGIATFLIALPWFLDALWAGRTRRVFVIAWLCVYIYVGAIILIPFAIVHVACVRRMDRQLPWRLLAATVGGLVVGMLAHPGWPAQWTHVANELRTIVEFDPEMMPGIMRGGEWAPMVGKTIAIVVGPALAAWMIVLVHRLGSNGERVSTRAITATVCALGLFGVGMFNGSKMLELFAIVTILGVPQVATAMRWPRQVPIIAGVPTLALAGRNVVHLVGEMDRPGYAHPADYAALGGWLAERTDPTEMIVAPWDDMPGLYANLHDQRFVAGWNVQFLRDADPIRFQAYYQLFMGQISDPENLLPKVFDHARFLILRAQPRHPGEQLLLEQVTHSAHFEPVASPAPLWKIFRVRG